MIVTSLQQSKQGFSILMALGTIWVLLIVTIGLATVFQKEMQLSRLQYDSILSYAQAEWAFEYAMLKIRNHPDGFSDTMNSLDPDSRIFSGASSRTDNVKVGYSIRSHSIDYSFSGGFDMYKVFPLFIGKCQWIIGTASSCDPRESSLKEVVRSLEVRTNGNPNLLSWSIVAQNWSENISISGTGEITGSEKGIMRIQWETCLSSNWTTIPCTGWLPVAERLSYFYDKEGSVSEFLANPASGQFAGLVISSPYLLLETAWPSVSIRVKTNTPFTLPETVILAEGRKGNALQAIEFREDKAKYLEALKYGIYNTTP